MLAWNRSARFLSPDPLDSSARRSRPSTWNRYTYANNSPLIYWDPNGLEPVRDEDSKDGSQEPPVTEEELEAANEAANPKKTWFRWILDKLYWTDQGKPSDRASQAQELSEDGVIDDETPKSQDARVIEEAAKTAVSEVGASVAESTASMVSGVVVLRLARFGIPQRAAEAFKHSLVGRSGRFYNIAYDRGLDRIVLTPVRRGSGPTIVTDYTKQTFLSVVRDFR